MSTFLHEPVHKHRHAVSSLGADPVRLETMSNVDNKPFRRRYARQNAGTAELTERRRNGARLMAALAIAALTYRRHSYDSPWILLVEILVCGSLVATAWMVGIRSSNRSSARGHPLDETASTTDTTPGQPGASPLGHDWQRWSAHLGFWQLVMVTSALAFPWLMDLLARAMDFGNGYEILMLTSLAWGGVAAAWVGIQRRTISLSVVCSGFLILFTTFISDSNVALLFSFIWAIICLWWLVANHWEQVDAYAATQVKPARAQRLSVFVVGCAAFILAISLVGNRLPPLRKLTAEVMPTSGGSGATDDAAWKGIGSGDALVAARDHATSFGAVETDLFLDSDQPSLFDMFSDEFGEPQVNKRVERAQALSPQEAQVSEQQAAEANRGSGNDCFSTRRDPPRHRPQVDDLASKAIFFWSGQSGVRLAVQRFSHFDGSTWFPSRVAEPADQATHAREQQDDHRLKSIPLEPVEIEDRTWFRQSGRVVQSSLSPFVDSIPEAIKFTRYRSSTIPTRQGIQLWSIDRLSESNFFELDEAEILSMPGREHVPDYTVVRFVNSQIDLERLDELLQVCSPGESHSELTPDCRTRVAGLAHSLAGNRPRGWQQVSSIIEGLRDEFQFDRQPASPGQAPRENVANRDLDTTSSDSPLEEFLQQRRGPSYLFATAAALMLEHLGYQTRLVTGFYIEPQPRLSAASESAVMPRDVHVWLEINVGHGYWIPLEPTPGYRPPPSTASWLYRVNQIKYELGLGVLAVTGVAFGLFLWRRILFELACRLAWPVASTLNDRRRTAWLTRVLDTRSYLAGRPRLAGSVPRSWFQESRQQLPENVHRHIHIFCNESDRLCFGGGTSLSTEGRQAVRHLWKHLTVDVLRQGDRIQQERT